MVGVRSGCNQDRCNSSKRNKHRSPFVSGDLKNFQVNQISGVVIAKSNLLALTSLVNDYFKFADMIGTGVPSDGPSDLERVVVRSLILLMGR